MLGEIGRGLDSTCDAFPPAGDHRFMGTSARGACVDADDVIPRTSVAGPNPTGVAK